MTAEAREPRSAAPSAAPSPDESRARPRRAYEERLGSRTAELERWSRREHWVGYARLAALIATFVVAWLAVQNRLFSTLWVLLPLALFLALLPLHERVIRRRDRLARAVDFYRLGLARLDDDWVGHGPAGERLAAREEEHLYAGDLDLFGEGSLYQLLSTARTRAGEETLASWLLAPASLEEVRARQDAVRDLRGRLDLREDLFTYGQRLHDEVDRDAGGLGEWAQATSGLEARRRLRPLLVLLAGANVAGAIGWAAGWWGPSLLLVSGAIGILVYVAVRSPVLAALRGIEQASRDLTVLTELLGRIERERFEAEWLERRAAELRGAGGAPGPGAEVRRLQRLVDLLDSRRNPIFAPFGVLLFWTTQLAFALEGWRQRHRSDVVRWMRLVGELEAIASLASYSFEHPADPFPELLEAATPRIVGRGLGHPLLPERLCVRNDLDLSGDVRALVVSGSNMSGKSTYLRTCGINVVLALAGAPVRAHSLELVPVRIGASIQIVDSLMEGASKFYAEIKRLRSILDLTEGELPCFFLLDEILHGTNSHDRRIGAAAVLRALIERGAIGLVTTHDLALSEIASEPGSRMRNVHFEDTVEEGRVLFDYQLRDGVVTRSNALALMREVGLDV